MAERRWITGCGTLFQDNCPYSDCPCRPPPFGKIETPAEPCPAHYARPMPTGNLFFVAKASLDFRQIRRFGIDRAGLFPRWRRFPANAPLSGSALEVSDTVGAGTAVPARKPVGKGHLSGEVDLEAMRLPGHPALPRSRSRSGGCSQRSWKTPLCRRSHRYLRPLTGRSRGARVVHRSFHPPDPDELPRHVPRLRAAVRRTIVPPHQRTASGKEWIFSQ